MLSYNYNKFNQFLVISYLFTNPLIFFVYIFSLLLAVTIHEAAHALVADRLGDPTPRLAGRISLNPLVHMDFFGTLFLLLFGFGWGKPVRFDPFNLKNPRRDAAIISVAGPLSNFMIAIVASLALRVVMQFGDINAASIIQFFTEPIIKLNIILGVFNFIPVQPLDGFKIVGGLLPEKSARDWYQLESYGLIFLIMLLFPINGHSMLDLVVRPVVNFVLQFLIPSVGGGVI